MISWGDATKCGFVGNFRSLALLTYKRHIRSERVHHWHLVVGSSAPVILTSVRTNAPYDSLWSQNYLHWAKIRRPKKVIGHLGFRRLLAATGDECHPEDQRIGLHLWSWKKWDLFFEVEHDRHRSSAEYGVRT